MTDEPSQMTDADAPSSSEAAPQQEAAGTQDSTNGEASDEEAEQTREEHLEQQVEELKEERDELNEKLLRRAAEFDNYRNRMDREKSRRYQAGKVEAIEPFLEVIDDFERSLEAAQDLEETQDPESAYQSLKGGVEMVFRKFQDTLETLGVEPIEAEGQSFDESVHEAMMRQPTEEAEPGAVLQEIRKGYRMGDRVIRYSRVVVAAPPTDDA